MRSSAFTSTDTNGSACCGVLQCAAVCVCILHVVYVSSYIAHVCIGRICVVLLYDADLFSILQCVCSMCVFHVCAIINLEFMKP